MDINRLCSYPITKGAVAQHKKRPKYLISWHKKCNAFYVPTISARYPKCGKNVATFPKNLQKMVKLQMKNIGFEKKRWLILESIVEDTKFHRSMGYLGARVIRVAWVAWVKLAHS